jgi:hypothetical protein
MRNRFYNYLWEARLKARAIDNQLFVVGINRYGEIGNERYLGKSMVVSPRGEIIYACKKGEEIAPIELDLDGIIKERGSEPTFSEFEIVIYDKFMEHFQGLKIYDTIKYDPIKIIMTVNPLMITPFLSILSFSDPG